jgi:hypothetical protein
MSEQEIEGIGAPLCQGLSICMRNPKSVTIEIHGASRSVYASHPSREVAKLIKDAARQTKSE